MKKSVKVLFVAALASAQLAATALGQVLISFDENGNGLGPSGGPLPSALTPDPISGVITLSYTLPFPVAPGDLLLSESQGTNVFSDLVRFGGPSRNEVWFFSELEPGELFPDKADLLQVPPAATNAIPLVENGPEGNNGVIWLPLPGSGLPGAAGSAFGQVQYHIVSDIPEPGGLSLAALGGLTLALGWWRRSTRR